MINYTDILIEALEDNHIKFLGVYHSKNKLSLKKNMIEDLYIEWFLSKAQIIDRDFYIESNVFIDKCLERVILMMQVLKDDKSRHEEFIQFGFMFTALGGMKKAMDDAEPETFANYLSFNNKKQLIDKIKKADRSTPKKIYIILKALFDNGILLLSDNETVYKAYYNEFSYQKSYETLKRGLNNYDFKKTDKINQQNISNMYDYLIS